MKEVAKLLAQVNLYKAECAREDIVRFDKEIAGLNAQIAAIQAKAFNAATILTDELEEEKNFPSLADDVYRKQVAKALKDAVTKRNSY